MSIIPNFNFLRSSVFIFVAKNIVFAFALLCSSSLLAQFSFNGTSQTGIQSATNTASGFDAFAVGYETTASGIRIHQGSISSFKKETHHYRECFGIKREYIIKI